MGYCSGSEGGFISDYHYRKASEYWRSLKSESSASVVTTPPVSTQDDGAANSATGANFGPTPSAAASPREYAGALALSGRIRAGGIWNIGQAELSRKGPRPPVQNGEYTLTLYDSAGIQLYGEPLATTHLNEGEESFWAARTPLPLRTAREIVISDAQGNEVLRQNLPELE